MKVRVMEPAAMLVILLASGVCRTVDLPVVDAKPNTVIMCPATAAAEAKPVPAPEQPAARGKASGSSKIFDTRFAGGWG
jgi:hypothetical protein